MQEEHKRRKSCDRAITKLLKTYVGRGELMGAVESPTLDQLPLSVAVRSHAMTALDFEPGTKYQYSNAGTNTAGRIIEVVSGLRYEDFMQQRLLEPLGMHDTTFWPDKKQLSCLAKTYKTSEAETGLEESETVKGKSQRQN
ncbi:MAG: serine hydrolase domain-containing protein [bacterium]|jgi:CubicO group peptidase (beta-lactamase class C family)